MTDDDVTTSNNDGRRRVTDDIVGLNVGGQMFYSHRSTLTTLNATGSSIAARIDDTNMIPAGDEYKDERGRTIYFFDRNGNRFHFILDYFRKGRVNLPPFANARALWRDLRDEAEFYCIDGLLKDLYVTHEIKPNKACCGIFHWLGCNRGRNAYMNPFDSGKVKVFDGTDDPILYPAPQRIDGSIVWEDTPAALVQFKTPVVGLGSVPHYHDICLASKQCDFFRKERRFSVVVDLDDIRVRPVAYSLRHVGGYESEFFCGNWNLEASQDGTDGSWDVLHEAREDPNLGPPQEEDLLHLCNRIERLRTNEMRSRSDSNLEYAKSVPLSHAEEKMRHTWDIAGGMNEDRNFYRFFRLKSIPGAVGLIPGLNAVGFELFGEIHEL